MPVSRRSAWVLDSVIKSSVIVLVTVATMPTFTMEVVGIMRLLIPFISPSLTRRVLLAQPFSVLWLLTHFYFL